MCLYPKLIKNRKYCVTKKNGGEVPKVTDPRVLWVPVGCQVCMECKKQKARNWAVRLQEEIRENKGGQFITLTFSNESIAELTRDIAKENEGVIPDGYDLDNDIATLAVRRFLERWRKKYKVSIKHWLITELGQGKNWKWQGTENIHLHGILFVNHKSQIEDIKKIWGYGFVFRGEYVNNKSVNYMVKYVNKVDKMHSQYKSKILCSPGIGSGYTKRVDSKLNKFKEKGETDERYTNRQGFKMALPIYFRNKIYSEAERELLWLQKLDKQERWVNGIKVSVKNGMDNYYNLLVQERKRNARLGYGNNDITKNWSKLQYENERRRLLLKKRIEKIAKVQEQQDKFI